MEKTLTEVERAHLYSNIDLVRQVYNMLNKQWIGEKPESIKSLIRESEKLQLQLTQLWESTGRRSR